MHRQNATIWIVVVIVEVLVMPTVRTDRQILSKDIKTFSTGIDFRQRTYLDRIFVALCDLTLNLLTDFFKNTPL